MSPNLLSPLEHSVPDLTAVTDDATTAAATTASAATTVSAAIAAELEQHATDVFALMGNGNAWFLDAVLRRGAMAVKTVRHEAATVAAADAYFRSSGRIAIATTTHGMYSRTKIMKPTAVSGVNAFPTASFSGEGSASSSAASDAGRKVEATFVTAPFAAPPNDTTTS